MIVNKHQSTLYHWSRRSECKLEKSLSYWDILQVWDTRVSPKRGGRFLCDMVARLCGMSTKRGFQKEKGTFHAHPEPHSEEKKNKAKQNVFGETK